MKDAFGVVWGCWDHSVCWPPVHLLKQAYHVAHGLKLGTDTVGVLFKEAAGARGEKGQNQRLFVLCPTREKHTHKQNATWNLKTGCLVENLLRCLTFFRKSTCISFHTPWLTKKDFSHYIHKISMVKIMGIFLCERSTSKQLQTVKRKWFLIVFQNK